MIFPFRRSFLFLAFYANVQDFFGKCTDIVLDTDFDTFSTKCPEIFQSQLLVGHRKRRRKNGVFLGH